MILLSIINEQIFNDFITKRHKNIGPNFLDEP
jgi:hypothetical protein